MMSNNTEEIAQNKLLILYIIKNCPFTLNNAELTELVLKKNYINYFFLQQYLSEIIESELLEIFDDNGKKIYRLLPKGEVTLDLLNNKIPDPIKNQLNSEFDLQKNKKIKDTQVVGEYFPKGNNQYTVSLKLVENEDTLFSLYLEVASIAQAELFCAKWKEDTEQIYQKIINMFL